MSSQRREFLGEHEVTVVGRSIDERRSARRGRKSLEQRPQRRDPDAPGDQHDAAVREAARRECAIRAFGEHAHSGLERSDAMRVVADVLDSDAEVLVVRDGGE